MPGHLPYMAMQINGKWSQTCECERRFAAANPEALRTKIRTHLAQVATPEESRL